MTRIGITGHMNLTSASESLVDTELRTLLESFPAEELTGFSCIAPGADSIFAEAILSMGGRLEVVLPASDYREHKVKPDFAPVFDGLVEHASKVHVMPHSQSNRAAYESANLFILRSVDFLFAVWDGKAPADQGGTAAVVKQAQELGLPVQVVWPAGAMRRE